MKKKVGKFSLHRLVSTSFTHTFPVGNFLFTIYQKNLFYDLRIGNISYEEENVRVQRAKFPHNNQVTNQSQEKKIPSYNQQLLSSNTNKINSNINSNQFKTNIDKTKNKNSANFFGVNQTSAKTNQNIEVIQENKINKVKLLENPKISSKNDANLYDFFQEDSNQDIPGNNTKKAKNEKDKKINDIMNLYDNFVFHSNEPAIQSSKNESSVNAEIF